MAVQITKLGTLPGTKKYVAICARCKTEFNFLQSDGKISDRNEVILRITCPLPDCGNTLCVNI